MQAIFRAQDGGPAVPAARTADLLTTEVGDELLVYDTTRDHIHHLNRTATAVWRLCDGRRSVPELVCHLRLVLDTDVDEDGVREAIAKLDGAHLLITAPAWKAIGDAHPGRRLSRRKAVAAGAAIIVSMTAPTAAAAQSTSCIGRPNGANCGTCLYCNNGVCQSCDQIVCAANGVCEFGCFVAGTRVAMADGTSTPIESVAEGDRVLGHAGVNTVLAVFHPTLGDRPLYAFNDGTPFVTASHPFLTEYGWKAVDPVAARPMVPGLPVGRLAVGDRVQVLVGLAVPAMVGGDGAREAVVPQFAATALARLARHRADPATPLYHLAVDGDHTYLANDFVVHNKVR